MAIGTPYVFGVSALSLYGFWSTFNINIFEFIGINDIVKLAIYNIVTSSGSFLLGYLLAIPSSNKFPPGGGADTPIGKFGRKHWNLLVGIDLIIIAIIIILLKSPDKWLLILPFICFISIPLTHIDFIIQLIPNPQARINIILLLIALPALSFYNAKFNSYKISEGRGNFIVDLHQSNLWITSDKSIGYVGLAGDYFIFYGIQTRRIFVVKVKDKGLIVLAPNPASVSDNQSRSH